MRGAADNFHALAKHATAPQPAAYQFDLLAGHLLQGRPLVANELSPTSSSAVIQRDAWGMLRIASAQGPLVLRVRSLDNSPGLITPIPQSAAAHLSWTAATSGDRPDVLFQLDHPQAQLLLSFLRGNSLAEAELAASSTTLTAAQLLKAKKYDPVAGALGAYTLLRQSDHVEAVTAELDERSAQLWKYNRTFPDAACIRAECLARSGEHALALETLLHLNSLGLPLFSAGLNIACLRLADYLEGEALTDLGGDQRPNARVLLRRLRWLGLHAVPGESILKLVHFDPSNATQYAEFWYSTEI
jgi:hypothetical protein